MAGLTYRFGPFCIDSESRLLFRNGERVPLPPKAADVLLALVERDGQLLAKDDLLKQVWPDTFVEEGNLARNIFLLRKILGESPEGPYVETVPKRGYRFTGRVHRDPPGMITVQAEEHTTEHVIVEETETRESPRRQLGRRHAVITLGLAIATSVLAWIVWARAHTPASIRSLLVLPFANQSIESDSEYFSDGLTDELIGAFSGVRGLRVVPRTTAFQFKGKAADVRVVGHQFEADAVLDGAVQRTGDRIRIRLALTRVSDGHTIWSQTYDRRTQDMFKTQEQIAQGVLRAVFPREQQNRIDVPSPSGTTNLEAQNLYLRANFIRQKYTNPSFTEALALFAKATELDPAYAQAWAGQAFCYAELGYGYLRYPKDVFPLAIKAVDRALALNPRLAFAHATRGYLSLVYLRDWETARRELETALEADPNDGESHHWMSHYWTTLGRFREATEESRRALECDPLNFTIGAHQVWVELERGDYPAAIRTAEPTLRLDPLHGPTMYYLQRAYEESMQLHEAIEIQRRMGWRSPSPADLEAALAANGPIGYWGLIVAESEERRKVAPVRPFSLAVTNLHVGERERALEWLELAVAEGDPWVVYMKVDPALAGLRKEARFQQLVRRAGFP
jgi:TolB-like protein/DNA-binding winged helix-turn-helix (wHTH) protein/tetratricopeptide (TPR) repeat protein